MERLLILPVFLFLARGIVYADAIYLKDGQELKGVIVEDYHDRILLSTEKGERTLAKNEIEDIRYDAVEDNFVRLGAFYKDKGDYKTALYYYEAAYKKNPDMKEAQDGTLLLGNMILRKKQSDLESEVALKQDTEEKVRRRILEDEPGQILEKQKEGLKRQVGIVIETPGGDVKISGISRRSPAYEAGIRQGDTIVAVWGRLIRYMQLKDVYKLLLDNKVSELRIVIARDSVVYLKKKGLFNGAEDMLGGAFKMEFEGLTVDRTRAGEALDKAGILRGDRVTKIGEASTRYMPFEAACKTIEGEKGGFIKLGIEREVVFWKR